MSQKLVIPPLALVLGLVGAIFLGAGLYGLLVPQQTLMPLLSQPAVGWGMTAVGAILIAAETFLLLSALRRR